MDSAAFDAQIEEFVERGVEDRVDCVTDQAGVAAKGGACVVGAGLMDLIVPG